MRQNFVKGEKLSGGKRYPSILKDDVQPGDEFCATFKGTYSYAHNGKEIVNLVWQLHHDFKRGDKVIEEGEEIFINGSVLAKACETGTIKKGHCYVLVMTGFVQPKNKSFSTYPNWEIYASSVPEPETIPAQEEEELIEEGPAHFEEDTDEEEEVEEEIEFEN